MTIETVDPSDHRVRDAAEIVQAAALEADGTAPFGEQTVLSWTRPDDGDRHLVIRNPAGLPIGYAHLDAHGTAELAVHPEHRRAGHGRALLERLQVENERTTNPPALQVWSHGDQPGGRALAATTGFQVVRELLQLRRTLDATFPGPEPQVLPAGVRVRAFRPGEDDAAWLDLNARAFAHHPEQGRMTQADLQARMDEPWFDPAGFLLAEQDGVLIGFHWTKIHPEGLGEVYVLGVDPDRHGGGLGRALTRAGLQYLYDRGLRTVLLYVESDNVPALAVYHRLGFTTWFTDVMYQRP